MSHVRAVVAFVTALVAAFVVVAVPSRLTAQSVMPAPAGLLTLHRAPTSSRAAPIPPAEPGYPVPHAVKMGAVVGGVVGAVLQYALTRHYVCHSSQPCGRASYTRRTVPVAGAVGAAVGAGAGGIIHAARQSSSGR